MSHNQVIKFTAGDLRSAEEGNHQPFKHNDQKMHAPC